eukprot:2480087-Amphidinium_carterae.1
MHAPANSAARSSCARLAFSWTAASERSNGARCICSTSRAPVERSHAGPHCKVLDGVARPESALGNSLVPSSWGLTTKGCVAVDILRRGQVQAWSFMP